MATDLARRWASTCICLLGSFLANLSVAAPLPRRAAVGIHLSGPSTLVAGTPASYQVAVHWATGPERTGPLPGARVSLALGRGGRWWRLLEGRSDAAGLLQRGFQVPALAPGDYQLQVVARAALGEGRERETVRVVPGGRILLTTDKPLYQPAQTIQARVLALRTIDRAPLRDKPVVFSVVDPRGNTVAEERRRTSAFGVASFDLVLADEVNLGRYLVRATVEGSGEHAQAERSVKVARYSLPRFEVQVRAERKAYRPGARLRGTVVARYHFGKPVRDARVRVSVVSDQCSRISASWRCASLEEVLQTRTDAAGQAELALTLPRCRSHAPCVDGQLRIRAEVTDQANQRIAGSTVLPLSQLVLRLALAVPGQALVPGLPNDLHVLVGTIDGRPVQGARVQVRTARETVQARSDGLGIATLRVTPGPAACPTPRGRGITVAVTVEGPLGHTRTLEQCVALSASPILVRPESAFVASGEALRVEVLARGEPDGELVHLDLVKEQQPVASLAQPLRGGSARFSFQPGRGLEGLVTVRGFLRGKQGGRLGHARVVYLEPRARLAIEARLDRESYRPGGTATLDLLVRNSATGKGVQAALGLSAVDAALLALAAESSEDPSLFFALAGALLPEEREPLPRGLGLRAWLAEEPSSERRRAAEVLISRIAASAPELVESDPWRRRRERWEEQSASLIAAAREAVGELAVGQLAAGRWDFHPRLVELLVRAGKVPRSALRDPWEQEITPGRLRAIDPELDFSALALEAAPEKLERLYELVFRNRDRLGLRRQPVRGLERGSWPYLVPGDLLARLRGVSGVRRSTLLDPWGRPFRLRLLGRGIFVRFDHPFASHVELYSAGPDGASGTADDLRPPGIYYKDLSALVAGGVGYGRGCGSLRGRRAAAPRVMIGRASVRGALDDGGPRLESIRPRQRFPETLIWKPELITDAAGRARVAIPLADSITTWRLRATASSLGGLLGAAELDLRVFQPFFLDLDLPSHLTVGDRLSLPITVHNYLKTPQAVLVRVDPAPWFEARGPLEHTLSVKPGEAAVHHFPLRALLTGGQTLTVRAEGRGQDGKRVSDAVQRSARVEPDGREHGFAHAGTLDASVEHRLEIPEHAIAGSSHLQLSVHPGPLSQTLTGLEAMLEMPHGCFEQTSSSLYPNLLVLDYLRRAGKATPTIEATARRYIRAGYQRLLTFEVKGGGFSWFGEAPASAILTAYGLMEFTDLGRVHRVDPRIVARTRGWLARRQNPDGSWSPDLHYYLDGVVNDLIADRLRITAYIADALARSGERAAVQRALGYVRRNLAKARDAYTLALVGNLFARARDPLAASVLERLWALRVATRDGIQFPGPGSSLTYGRGSAGEIETTALAALALIRARRERPSLPRLLSSLLARKDPSGGWQTTQATILSLRALLEERTAPASRGQVTILVDGIVAGKLRLDGKDRASHLDLTRSAGHGSHRVALRVEGTGGAQYQLSGRYWMPVAEASPSPAGALALTTRYTKSTLRAGEEVRLQVSLENRGAQPVRMPLLSLALPPGFELEPSELERLVGKHGVQKLQQLGNRAVLYLSSLEARARIPLELRLRSKYPLEVRSRPSLVYEYYQPQNRAESLPGRLTVL